MILDSDTTRQRVLDKFLQICPLEGWSDEALHQAVSACNIDEKFSAIIFENGRLGVAEFYIQSQNEKCTKLVLSQDDFANKKIHQKITTLLYTRFEIEKEHQLALQRLANFFANPKNFTKFEIGARPLCYGFKACFKIADLMWKTIQDQSTDFNFYTKRLTLAKIILRSFLVFLKDNSEDLQHTKDFIDTQIEGVMKFAKRKAQIKNFVKKSGQRLKGFVTHEDCSTKSQIKSPREILRSLPFIRLIKK